MLSFVLSDPLKFNLLRCFSDALKQKIAKPNAGDKEKNISKETIDSKLQQIEKEKLYLLAETENMRKRFDKLEREMKQNVTADVINKILPITDNLNRIVKSGTKQNVQQVLDAIKLTDADFHSILKGFNVVKIESSKQTFNPKVHEAIQMIDTQGQTKSGDIHEVYLEGYLINDKVIRPAKVIVSK